jgi:antitoxin YefM
MKVVGHSEARDNLEAIIGQVVADRAPARRRGVLVSKSEWASIEETLHLLRGPRNAARLLNAVRGFETGEAGADERGVQRP